MPNSQLGKPHLELVIENSFLILGEGNRCVQEEARRPQPADALKGRFIFTCSAPGVYVQIEKMKGRPKIGTEGELRFTVEQKHVIDFATEGMPAVLSTPHLIGLLERTARESLSPLLEPNERSVGIELEVRHLAPTPLGAQVTCRTRVIGAEGHTVTFHVEARDEQEILVRGLHKRAVIRVEAFARRIARKLKNPA